MKETDDKKPTFLWASPLEYKFNKENKIITKGLE